MCGVCGVMLAESLNALPGRGRGACCCNMVHSFPIHNTHTHTHTHNCTSPITAKVHILDGDITMSMTAIKSLFTHYTALCYSMSQKE